MNVTTTTDLQPGTLDADQATNKLAFLAYQNAAAKVHAAAQTGGYPVPKDVFAAYEQAGQDLHRSAVKVCSHQALGAEVWTADIGRMFVASIDAGVVTITADGGLALPAWHARLGVDSVYYERYSERGRETHGWIDPTSRKITQTG